MAKSWSESTGWVGLGVGALAMTLMVPSVRKRVGDVAESAGQVWESLRCKAKHSRLLRIGLPLAAGVAGAAGAAGVAAAVAAPAAGAAAGAIAAAPPLAAALPMALAGLEAANETDELLDSTLGDEECDENCPEDRPLPH